MVPLFSSYSLFCLISHVSTNQEKAKIFSLLKRVRPPLQLTALAEYVSTIVLAEIETANTAHLYDALLIINPKTFSIVLTFLHFFDIFG